MEDQDVCKEERVKDQGATTADSMYLAAMRLHLDGYLFVEYDEDGCAIL